MATGTAARCSIRKGSACTDEQQEQDSRTQQERVARTEPATLAKHNTKCKISPSQGYLKQRETPNQNGVVTAQHNGNEETRFLTMSANVQNGM